MNAALNSILAHTMATLPDSIQRRKELLSDLVAVLPRNHPLRGRVDGLRLHLEAHEAHQLQLSLDFQKPEQPTRPSPLATHH